MKKKITLLFAILMLSAYTNAQYWKSVFSGILHTLAIKPTEHFGLGDITFMDNWAMERMPTKTNP
jgi:hypothetical protein